MKPIITIAILILIITLTLALAIRSHLDHLEISASYERQINELHNQIDFRDGEIERLKWFKAQWYEMKGE